MLFNIIINITIGTNSQKCVITMFVIDDINGYWNVVIYFDIPSDKI